MKKYSTVYLGTVAVGLAVYAIITVLFIPPLSFGETVVLIVVACTILRYLAEWIDRVVKKYEP
jgi:hypothetical protein